MQKKSFDLSALSGPHQVSHIVHHPPSISNTTYTLDICRALKVPKKTPKKDTCPNSTRVCAIERVSNAGDDESVVASVIPIAGNFDHGRPIDAMVTRLKTDEDERGNREGLRLELHGGQYPLGKKGRKQKAVIELLCHKNGDDDDKRRAMQEKRKDVDDDDEDDDGGEEKDESDTEGLKFVSYGPGKGDEKDEDILQLEWVTKHACEGRTDKDGEDPSSQKGHWGFFTWFIIMSVTCFPREYLNLD